MGGIRCNVIQHRFVVRSTCNHHPVITFNLEGQSRGNYDKSAVDIRERKIFNASPAGQDRTL